MKPKYRLPIFIALIILLIFIGSFYFLKSAPNTKMTVKIVDRGYSICTQDIPSSDCGPYKVTVRTEDGQTITYSVAGFSNRNSKLYYDVSSKITSAKEQDRMVTIKTNDNDEIISVQ